MAASDRVTEAGWSNSPSGLGGLTLPIERTSDHAPPTDVEQDPKFSAQGAQYWIVALIAGLVGLWLLRRGSEHLRGNAIAVSFFNFLAVGIMAILGILALKMTTSLIPVPGLTALAHAV
jgi:hypothetical protein